MAPFESGAEYLNAPHPFECFLNLLGKVSEKNEISRPKVVREGGKTTQEQSKVDARKGSLRGSAHPECQPGAVSKACKTA